MTSCRKRVEVLEELLEEPIAPAKSREACALDEVAKGRSNAIVLFGAGQLGRKALYTLRANGVEPLAFADNDQARWGRSIDGLRIVSPQDAAGRWAKSALFVVTIWSPGHSFRHTAQQLADLGCETVSPFLPLFWKYPRELLPHYLFDCPHSLLSQAAAIRTAYGLWEDEESRIEYMAQLKLRFRADFLGLSEPKPRQFFPADIVPARDYDAFVDGGAYTGDTLQTFLEITKGNFSRAWVIEPDPLSSARLGGFVQSLDSLLRERIVLIDSALSSRTGMARFAVSGLASATLDEEGTDTVPCSRLDDLLKDDCATLIKLDIEGAELDALQGAEKLIARCRPTLAVCVYHRPEHLWKIPLYLRNLAPEYALFLRPHMSDGLDAVTYAVPRTRKVGTT